jgi:predicted aspartyl protease
MNKYVIRADISAERLAETGPVVSGSWARQHDELGREIRGEFLIDTGAYGAMIDLAVAEMLPLSPLGTRAVHGIHGYGTLQLYLGRVYLPAVDVDGKPTLYSTVLECVGVPSLREKSHEHRADVIGILGRIFLRNASFTVDHLAGKLELALVEQLRDNQF